MKNTWLLHDNFEGIPEDAKEVLDSFESIEDSAEECAEELASLGYVCEFDFDEITEIRKED
jgi:hypothetical protein